MFSKIALSSLFSLLIIVSCIQARSLSMEDRQKIGMHCAKTTGMDPDVVKRAVKTNSLLTGDTYKQFLVCSYRLQGYMDPDSSRIYHSAIAKFLSDYYAPEEVTYVIKDCKYQAESPTEAVYSTLKCLMRKLKEVDVMRAAPNENDENHENEIDK